MSEAKYELRRLEVGEQTKPGTDFGISDYGEVLMVTLPYPISHKQPSPIYRISLAQPVAPEQGEAGEVAVCSLCHGDQLLYGLGAEPGDESVCPKCGGLGRNASPTTEPTKREALSAAGWKSGDAADFLGMSDDERKQLDERMEPASEAKLLAACEQVLDAWEYDRERIVGKVYDAKLAIQAAVAEAKAQPQPASFHDFATQQAEWSQATFGTDKERGPLGPLKHLIKEANECLANPTDVTEFADCLFLVLDASRRAGFDSRQLLDAAWKKLAINKSREWPKPGDMNAAVEHVRKDAEPASEAPAEAGSGYYIEGKEVTQDELYRHVGAKVFEGLRKGNLPGCNSEVMRLREQVADLRKQLEAAKANESNMHDMLFEARLVNDGLDNFDAVKAIIKERDQLKAELAAMSDKLHQAGVTIGELQSQLAAAKPVEVQYAWRDARPEDVGKGYQCRVSDFASLWNENVILVDHMANEELPWKEYSEGEVASWKFCQVYAPVEAEAAKEEWKELTKNDQYSGPGQVRDGDKDEWRSAEIAIVLSDDFPFVAKSDEVGEYLFYRQARVRKEVSE